MDEVQVRPSSADTLMGVAETIRKRSTCLRGQVGTVIAREFRIISTGYNGSPPGAAHCLDVGCDVIDNDYFLGCQRAVHAEANAIAWAARNGAPTRGSIMYCTSSPCLNCAQLIVSAGITGFVFVREYRLLDGLDLLDELGISVQQMRTPKI